MKSGVLEYIPATATIFFEKGHVGCDWCQCLETYARKQCRLTGEYLIDTKVRGYWCPLVFDEERKDESNDL